MRRLLDLAPKERIIVPLDVSSIIAAKELSDMLSPHVGVFKIGLELIYSSFADLLSEDEAMAFAVLNDFRELVCSIGLSRIFLDVKLDDIPNTVGGASNAIARMGVKFFNVHASAGEGSIKASVANKGTSKLLGVTLLTSIGETECEFCYKKVPGAQVLYFANTLAECGADGIICSPKEICEIRSRPMFNEMIVVTPGVRPKGSATNDQKRVMTPGEAIIAGADYLVIGRPITAAPDPIAAAQAIAEEIRNAELMLE